MIEKKQKRRCSQNDKAVESEYDKGKVTYEEVLGGIEQAILFSYILLIPLLIGEGCSKIYCILCKKWVEFFKKSSSFIKCIKYFGDFVEVSGLGYGSPRKADEYFCI